MSTRLSTSNSSLYKFGLFVVIAIVAFATIEFYFRNDERFQTTNYYLIKHFLKTDPTNAVFGDSHVLWSPFIPGYTFYGTAGQQPVEFNRLVRYLYADHHPQKIIVEADPQWLGHYHINREQFITRENLVNKNFPLLLTSAYYYKSLKDNLVSTIKDRILQSISVLKSNILAHAQGTVDETPASTPTTPEERWAKMFVRPGYNWSLTSKEDRLFLTTQRVEAQNPIDDFRTSEPLKKFEAALSFLAARSAIICLFRTPVTVDYLSIERTIPRSNFDAWDQYIHTLAKSHGIKYVDFHELSYDFSDDKFANADHLTNAHYAEIWPMVAKACFN